MMDADRLMRFWNDTERQASNGVWRTPNESPWPCASLRRMLTPIAAFKHKGGRENPLTPVEVRRRSRTARVRRQIVGRRILPRSERSPMRMTRALLPAQFVVAAPRKGRGLDTANVRLFNGLCTASVRSQVRQGSKKRPQAGALRDLRDLAHLTANPQRSAITAMPGALVKTSSRRASWPDRSSRHHAKRLVRERRLEDAEEGGPAKLEPDSDMASTLAMLEYVAGDPANSARAISSGRRHLPGTLFAKSATDPELRRSRSRISGPRN